MTTTEATPAVAATRRPRRRLRITAETRAAWLMLLPAAVLLVWWFVVPIVQSVVLSVQQVGKFDFDQRSFVGLQNFTDLFADPAFGSSLGITAIFVLGVVPAQTVLALLVAATLHGVGHGKDAFRTAYFVPYMTSTIAITTIFMQLFVKGGLVPTVASLFGAPNVTWYATPSLALPFLIVVYVYMFVGLYIVIFAGGIETIPQDLYEAASMDGAGTLRKFWSVTLPGLRPFTVFAVVTGIIQAIQVFDQAYVIAGGTVLGSPAGATSTIVIFIYQQAFRLSNIGYASAATVVLLLIVIVAGVIARRLGPKEA